METIVVTAAIIKQDQQYLIAQRKKGSNQELKWEFPGGKVEIGEDPEDCLRREIKEELGLSVKIFNIYQVVSHNYGEKHIILLCYLCKNEGGEPSCIDCNDYRWVTVKEMSEYDFAPADIIVVESLKES